MENPDVTGDVTTRSASETGEAYDVILTTNDESACDVSSDVTSTVNGESKKKYNVDYWHMRCLILLFLSL